MSPSSIGTDKYATNYVPKINLVKTWIVFLSQSRHCLVKDGERDEGGSGKQVDIKRLRSKDKAKWNYWDYWSAVK